MKIDTISCTPTKLQRAITKTTRKLFYKMKVHYHCWRVIKFLLISIHFWEICTPNCKSAISFFSSSPFVFVYMIFFILILLRYKIENFEHPIQAVIYNNGKNNRITSQCLVNVVFTSHSNN